jgi:hypothetical protein
MRWPDLGTLRSPAYFGNFVEVGEKRLGAMRHVGEIGVIDHKLSKAAGPPVVIAPKLCGSLHRRVSWQMLAQMHLLGQGLNV